MATLIELEGITINAEEMLFEIERAKAENSLAEFIEQAWHVIEPGQEYIHNWHVDLICEHLEAITDGHVLDDGTPYNRLLINVPPGFSKSLITGVFWPAWEWGPRNKPHLRYVCASHSQDLAIRDGLRMRRLVTSEWYQKRWGDRVQLTGDQNQKCLERGTKILMADGSLRSIEDVKPGEFVLSYKLDKDIIVKDRVEHVWSNGIKPARRITLSDGTKITATHNHRLYGWDEFIYAEDMKVGDPLAVIERTPTQKNDLSDDDAFLLALWLAEGAKSNTSYMFSNTDPLIIQRVEEIARRRRWSIKKYGDCSYTVTSGPQTGDTPIGVLKKYIGSNETYGSRSKLIRQKCDTIKIPEAVFGASDSSVLEFIATYIATDGCVVNGKNHFINITTISERMARDLMILLRRFGVSSSLSSQNTYAVKDGIKTPGRRAWSVLIRTGSEILKLEKLYLYGKDEKFRSLLDWCRTKKRHEGSRSASIPPHSLSPFRWSSKKTALERAYAVNDAALLARLDGGLSWKRIVSIDEVDACETWHMETRDTHLFFAEGVLSHNTKFENTATGFRQATASGSITGSRGDRVVIDDALSVDGANSDAIRNSTKQWFLEAVPTRLNNPKTSAIVVIMQRLHEEDISGVILDKDLGYDHVMLPMLYEPARAAPTMLGIEDPRTEEGELLFPARFPQEVVERDSKAMGPYATAGQFQQSPEPRGGGIIKREWWQLWDEGAYPPMDYVVASLDTAYTTKQENDFSAMTVWGVFTGATKATIKKEQAFDGEWTSISGMVEREYEQRSPSVMLMSAWQEKLPLHELVEKVAATCRKMGVDKLLIEDKAAGHSVAQEIRRLYGHEDWMVQLINPGNIDKMARLYSVQHLFAEGMIHAPDRHWADLVINQCATFPRAKNDDLCLVAETLITMGDGGRRPICDINVGDWVATPKGPRRVVASAFTGVRPVWRLEHELGALEGTANHPIYVDGAWVKMADLTPNDTLTLYPYSGVTSWSSGLQGQQQSKASCSTVASTTGIQTPTTPLIADTLRDRALAFTATFGSFITARFQKAIKSIMLMGIRPTMTSLILSASHSKSTGQNITTSMSSEADPRSNWTIFFAFRKKQKHGIPAQKEGNGIDRTPIPLCTSREPQKLLAKADTKELAGGAEMPSSPKAHAKSFAPLNVHGLKAATTVVKAVKFTCTMRPVFNLTVEGEHCYYANGVLTHNCDTTSMALRHLREIGLLARAPEIRADISNEIRHDGGKPPPLYPV